MHKLVKKGNEREKKINIAIKRNKDKTIKYEKKSNKASEKNTIDDNKSNKINVRLFESREESRRYKQREE